MAGGAAKDLTPGKRDVPPFSLGGPDDYDVSPDGQEVCYSMNADPVPAISTNADLYVVPSQGGDAGSQDFTYARAPIPARSIRPTASTSPGARRFRAGYESDRWRLMVLERATGQHHESHREPGPLGQQFHLVARFERALLHHQRPRPAGDPIDPRDRRRDPHRGRAAIANSTTCS